MIISDKARRLGETILITFIAIALTGIWARGTADSKDMSYQARKQSDVTAIAQALRIYQIDHGRYPDVIAGLPFCYPFELQASERCLGELLGDYIRPDTVTFDENMYVYIEYADKVAIAADIPVDKTVATSNRCTISDFEFWCIKLPK